MDFLLTEEQIMLRDMVSKFAKEKIAPVASENERNHRFPWDIIREAGELGLMGVAYPSEYGGAGMDFVSYFLGYFLNSKEKYSYFYQTKLINYYLFKNRYKFYLDKIDKFYEEEYISSGVKINHEAVQNLLVLKQDKDIKLEFNFENFTCEDLKKIRPYLVVPTLDIQTFDVLFFDKNFLIKDNISKEFLRKLLLEINSYVKSKNLRFAFITNRDWVLENIKILKPNIMELLYLVSNSRVVISFDGGPVHIASAFNIPTIALFSNRYFYFDSYRWAPLADLSFIIKLDIFDPQLNIIDFSNLDYFNVFYQIRYFLDKII